MEDKEKQITEIWICDRNTLANARCVFTVSCGNHNGPSATFTDNDHIVFRDIINGFSAFRVLNIHTGEVVYGPIFGKESHCAENGQYPFSISEEFLDKNPDYPELNTCGIYLLDLTTGKIRRVADKKTVYDMVVKSGCTPNAHTTSMSHVQLNPSATKVMMRLSVANCPVLVPLAALTLRLVRHMSFQTNQSISFGLTMIHTWQLVSTMTVQRLRWNEPYPAFYTKRRMHRNAWWNWKSY